jgi:hypothetical protein
MLAYLGLTVLLLILGYWDAAAPHRTATPIVLATVALIIFVGFRFETGADWVEYETLLYMTAPIFTDMPMYFNPNLVVEPGFVFILSAINTLGLPFQALLVVSALNIAVLSMFLWRYSRQPVLVLLWYCGFALLLGQMAAIRQVIAYGFILLAFMAFDRGRSVASLLWSLLAISMHVFSIVLIPLVYLRLPPPRTRLVLALCGVGLATSIVGVNIFALLVAPVSLLLGGIVETKLEIYSGFASFQISPFSLLLVIWHAGVLTLINRRALEAWGEPVVRFAIYAAIWSLVAHTYLAALPAIWNRIMLLSMPLEMLALFRCYGNVLREPMGRLVAAAGVWIVSATSIGYGLSQDNALPYLPYRSIAQVWVTGDPGDGRLRYLIEQARLNRQAEEQRQP